MLALHSITTVNAQQQQVEGVLQYLGKHGQHVDSVSISGDGDCTVNLPLPPNVQLESLLLDGASLQVAWLRHGLLGVLGAPAGAAPALKQLRLLNCKPHDRGAADALAAAMGQLPKGLQHLSISNNSDTIFRFPAGVFRRRLPQLTHLELAGVGIVGSAIGSPALQDLQALAGLVDLRLNRLGPATRVTVSMLSGMHHLTRLELSQAQMEPGVLDGKTQLQHIMLRQLRLPQADGVDRDVSDNGDVGPLAMQTVQLLSHLQHLQQLTHLDLLGSLCSDEERNPAAAAYSALTASSKLAHLNISMCRLPADACQHVFPTGRKLLHLRYLDISSLLQPSWDEGIPPTGSSLVSCCPNLQSLDMQEVQFSSELLTALAGLTGLSTLWLAHSEYAGNGLEALSQLTGLQELCLWLPCSTQEGLLLQLTQLKQLAALYFSGQIDGPCREVNFTMTQQVRFTLL